MNCTAVGGNNKGQGGTTLGRPRRPTLRAMTSNGPFTLQLVQKPGHAPSLAVCEYTREREIFVKKNIQISRMDGFFAFPMFRNETPMK